MKKILPLICLTASLSACAPMSEQVMSPIVYKQPISMHSNKNAYLYWQVGDIHAGTDPQFISPQAGLVGGLVAAAVDSEMRKKNPSRYTFAYGKAQQAVFMTSLKDALEQNHVFKQTQLTTNLSDVKPNDVLIKIYFKSTRAASYEDNYKITLDVTTTIQGGNKAKLERTYLVQSHDPDGFFSGKNFKEQQTDVSTQLLKKVINTINQWNHS